MRERDFQKGGERNEEERPRTRRSPTLLLVKNRLVQFVEWCELFLIYEIEL